MEKDFSKIHNCNLKNSNGGFPLIPDKVGWAWQPNPPGWTYQQCEQMEGDAGQMPCRHRCGNWCLSQSTLGGQMAGNQLTLAAWDVK